MDDLKSYIRVFQQKKQTNRIRTIRLFQQIFYSIKFELKGPIGAVIFSTAK